MNWPPEDPTEYKRHVDYDEGYEFQLPDSPWTYDNGSTNPELVPSNSQLRQRHSKAEPTHSSVPPYHPDYNESIQDDTGSANGDEASDDDYYNYDSRPRIRRGSEGYEVRPVDREEILRRYILSRGREAGHYQRYVPEPESPESEIDDKES